MFRVNEKFLISFQAGLPNLVNNLSLIISSRQKISIIMNSLVVRECIDTIYQRGGEVATFSRSKPREHNSMIICVYYKMIYNYFFRAKISILEVL